MNGCSRPRLRDPSAGVPVVILLVLSLAVFGLGAPVTVRNEQELREAILSRAPHVVINASSILLASEHCAELPARAFSAGVCESPLTSSLTFDIVCQGAAVESYGDSPSVFPAIRNTMLSLQCGLPGGCELQVAKSIRARLFTVADGGHLSASNLVMSGGRAGSGGALLVGLGGKVDLTNALFIGNNATSLKVGHTVHTEDRGYFHSCAQ